MDELIHERLTKVETNIGDIKTDVAVIKTNVGHISEMLSKLPTRLKILEDDVVNLDKAISNTKVIWATISGGVVLVSAFIIILKTMGVF